MVIREVLGIGNNSICNVPIMYCSLAVCVLIELAMLVNENTVHATYRITGNVFCDFIFAKVKKHENLTTCNFHNMCILYCACSVCTKIKSRENIKLKHFATQKFPVIR